MLWKSLTSLPELALAGVLALFGVLNAMPLPEGTALCITGLMGLAYQTVRSEQLAPHPGRDKAPTGRLSDLGRIRSLGDVSDVNELHRLTR